MSYILICRHICFLELTLFLSAMGIFLCIKTWSSILVFMALGKMRPVFFVEKKKIAHSYVSAYVPSSTERIRGFLTKSNRLAQCRGLYSLKIWVAFVSSVKIKPRTRATVSSKGENMCASALRGAIIVQGVLLAMGRGSSQAPWSMWSGNQG